MILGMENVQLLARKAGESRNSSFQVRLHERCAEEPLGWRSASRWRRHGCAAAAVYWLPSVFQELLLTVASQVYLGRKSRQVIRTACQLLTCREGQRQFAGVFFFFFLQKPRFYCLFIYLFICFLLLLYFNEHFKHLLAITVCLSRALRQRFWGEEIGPFMSYEKTLKQLMHLSGDVS